jgi:hypothetical protein
MKKAIILSFIAVILIVSCGRAWTWADYMAIHKDGIQKLESSRQMNAQYVDVDNFIVHFGSAKQPLEWQTVAFIEGRFVLTYVQPVTVNYSKRSVTAAGEPKFVLHAAESIQMLDGDRAQTSYEGKLQREFGKIEWDRFVSSGYDLTSLGIPRDEIHPIPLWKEFVHSWRKDRLRIK